MCAYHLWLQEEENKNLTSYNHSAGIWIHEICAPEGEILSFSSNSVIIHISVANFFIWGTFFISNCDVCIHMTGMTCDLCHFRSKHCYVSALKIEVWLTGWLIGTVPNFFRHAMVSRKDRKGLKKLLAKIRPHFSSETCLCTCKPKINWINFILSLWIFCF